MTGEEGSDETQRSHWSSSLCGYGPCTSGVNRGNGQSGGMPQTFLEGVPTSTQIDSEWVRIMDDVMILRRIARDQDSLFNTRHRQDKGCRSWFT